MYFYNNYLSGMTGRIDPQNVLFVMTEYKLILKDKKIKFVSHFSIILVKKCPLL